MKSCLSTGESCFSRVFRTERRRNEQTGATYPWLVSSTAMVNQFYVYCMDREFGPFFLKFSSYFPYTTKLCICASTGMSMPSGN